MDFRWNEGWSRAHPGPLGPRLNPPRETFNVPLTHAHIQQLHKRRTDLLDHNLDRLNDIGADKDDNAITT